jgi:hypothetical protein
MFLLSLIKGITIVALMKINGSTRILPMISLKTALGFHKTLYNIVRSTMAPVSDELNAEFSGFPAGMTG